MAKQNFNQAIELARNYSEKIKKEKGLISIVQIGSSLRREDFRSNSDLDFLIIYKNPIKRVIELVDTQEIEINLIKRSKEQFLECLKEGNPVDLIALSFGKILYDTGFFIEAKKKDFKPSKKTVEKWLHTASSNFMAASTNYSFPSCMCCYFRDLYHSSRDFCRAIILEEQGKLLEGEKSILANLESNYPDLHKKFKLIAKGRKNYERFKQTFIKFQTIKNYSRGKYLLAAEDISIKAFKITKGLDVPKANYIIAQLQKDYDIESYNSSYIIPESEELMLCLDIKGDKLGFFRYDIKEKRIKEAAIK